ncbi:MAG: UDP-N-acetylmuramoyl-L-alanine--D-glutamate ligase [bacterium]
MEFPQYKGKKVLVWGLGLNDGGLGVVDFFVRQGANVTATDTKTKEQLSPTLKKLKKYGDKIHYVFGEHKKEDFENADLIIRSPAAKPGTELLKYVESLNKDVEMEISLFLHLKPCPIIGITGTRGKSTTTTLIYEMMKEHFGERVFLGGNIGKSVMRILPELNKDNIGVLEISSFHLDQMGKEKLSPEYCLVTNMYTDHLDWHENMDYYVNAKRNIFLNQSPIGFTVLNIDNDITRGFIKDVPSEVVTFSLKSDKANYYTDNNLDVHFEGRKLLSLKNSPLEGEHNVYNLTAAVSLTHRFGVSIENILKVVNSFKGIEGREEFVRELNGIKFYNDTTATSVEAIIAALERFGPRNKQKIVMISGGVDKGFDFSIIKEDVEKYVKAIVLLEGTASEKLFEEFQNSEIKIDKYFNNFRTAIERAYEIAEEGDMVILLPGGSSFNMFENEFDRGAQYNKIVKSLK